MPRKVRKLLFYLAVGLVLLIALFPFYWAFVNSIKRPEDTFQATWIPFLQFQPTFQHWLDELAIRETRRSLLNSLVIATGAATLALLIGTPAAYALARFRFRRPNNEFFITWFISQRVLPPVVVAIPFFLLFRTFGLLDQLISLILLNATFTVPLTVVIMTQMFRDVPSELEEAAFVDGASRLGALLRIALPLAAPGLIATWLLCFAFSWNEFLFGLTLTTKNAIPMPVYIAGAEHTRGVQFWFVGVRVLITILPPAILAVLAQRYIVRGLTLGALKG
ncbi:MAG: carbohydrate ABC transporter permease [Thermomicrobium sp.]